MGGIATASGMAILAMSLTEIKNGISPGSGSAHSRFDLCCGNVDVRSLVTAANACSFGRRHFNGVAFEPPKALDNPDVYAAA